MDFLSNLAVFKIIDILSLLILIFYSSSNKSLGSKPKKWLTVTSALTIVIIIAEFFTVYLESTASANIPLLYFINITGFTLTIILPICCSFITIKSVTHFIKSLFIIPSIVIILFITTPFTGLMFSFLDDGDYIRGPLYPLFIICYVICCGILLYVNIVKFKFLSIHNKLFLSAIIALVIVSSVTHILLPELYCSWYTVSICLILYYLFLSDITNKFDSLTLMLNRREFDNDMSRCARSKSIGIIMVDVDNFKSINDRLGHIKGDYYLEECAKLIRNQFEDIGRYYRIGGDEFCIFADTDNEELINLKISDIMQNIAEQQKTDSDMPSLSFGYSIYSKDEGISILESLHSADIAMYKNKKKKKK